MAETQVKPQRYTTAAVPLCREHLHQPALCDLLFPSRAYPLPKVVPGHEALIYDADAWHVWNGRRGIVTRYSFFLLGYIRYWLSGYGNSIFTDGKL